ncbi:hypothetical protein ACN20G_10200 [Streptomyces sp. BI20]|uniref:hypothetical protein n=1 Tax=Streptomyces sp. BI20 TaxID=3403460 RepID=UPI003C768227
MPGAGAGGGPAAEFDALFRGGPGDPAGHGTGAFPAAPPPRPVPVRRSGPVPPPSAPPEVYDPGPEEPSRRVSPAVIGATIIGLLVCGLGVGALLGDGPKQNNDPTAAAAPPSPAGSEAGAAGAVPKNGDAPDPARAQAVQLDRLLADSNASRASVVKAVGSIRKCENLDGAAEDLRDAARERQESVTRLQDLALDKLKDHDKLAEALAKAWRASASADLSYADWAEELDGDEDALCKGGKAKGGGSATAADRFSGEATKAKKSAATYWNRVARQYDLSRREAGAL